MQRTGGRPRRLASTVRLVCRIGSVLGLSSTCLSLLFSSTALAETAGISGKVSNSLTHQPIEGIEACALSTTASPLEEEEEIPGIFGCATTGSGGDYTISGLNAGGYDVIFAAPFKSPLNYVTQFYEGKFSFTEASTVTLTAGTIKSGVNAELEPGAEISGVVTEAATGTPLESILVCALGPLGGTSEAERISSCAISGAGGAYALLGLRGGSYDVLFFGGGRFASQAYNDKSTPAEAEPVAVSAGGSISGINAALAPGEGPSSVGSEPGGSSTGTGLLPSTGLTHGIGKKPGLSLGSRQILLRAHDAGIVKLTCIGSAHCRSRLTLTLRRSVRGHAKVSRAVIISTPVVVSLQPGASVEVRLSLNMVGRDLLKADGALPDAHLDFAAPGPSAGARVRARRVILETQTGHRG